MSGSHLTALPCEAIERICHFLYNFSPTLVYTNRGKLRQPSLAALATTCRQLSEPALDRLWHTPESLVPLLVYTLPDDLCAVVPLVETRINAPPMAVGYEVIFLREPVPEDFMRFTKYADRVRSLTDPPRGKGLFGNYQFSRAVWTKVLQYGPQPLFPNLRTLALCESHLDDSWDDVRGPPHRSREPLFGPRLKDVSIGYGIGPSDYHRPTEIVESLAFQSPLVESLSIFSDSVPAQQPSQSPPAPLSGPSIGEFSRLVEFNAPAVCMAPDALLALGSLPRLRQATLHVDSAGYDWEEALSRGRDRKLFPALTELHLREVSLEWCTAFVGIVSSSSVRILRLFDCVPAVYDRHMQVFFSSLADHPSASAIMVLNIITLLQRDSSATMPQIYRSEDVSPLLALPALEDVHIRGNVLIIVDDALLYAITRAWPKLVSLQLDWPRFSEWSRPGNPGDVHYPKATLAGVLLLARHCPRLETLVLPLDVREVPLLADRCPPVSLAPSHALPLKCLLCSGSALHTDKAALAMFLSAVFPQLAAFQSHHEMDASFEITEMYEGFVWIRQQERTWALANGRRLREPSWADVVREEAGASVSAHES